MINIHQKPLREEYFCPICFSHVKKDSIDKHIDEKHPRNGYIAKNNTPLVIAKNALDYLCPECYLTYEDIGKLKEHFNLIHHFSIKEEEIPEEKPVIRTSTEPPEKPSGEQKKYVIQSNPKQPVEKSISDFTLYVYDSLNPTRCNGGTYHSAENVTLETFTSNGIPVRFNAFYCSVCKKFYTNIEALERKFPLHNYPLIKMQFQSANPYEKRAYSDLALYGYTARAGALTEYERQNILIRVMVNGFLNKKQIIGLLKGFINYNGRASHMGNAVKIWENDIDFVSSFRLDSQKRVRVETVKIIYKGKIQ